MEGTCTKRLTNKRGRCSLRTRYREGTPYRALQYEIRMHLSSLVRISACPLLVLLPLLSFPLCACPLLVLLPLLSSPLCACPLLVLLPLLSSPLCACPLLLLLPLLSSPSVHYVFLQLMDWFVQICLAVKHVHDRKILHRDIKSQVSWCVFKCV